jgi:hypothetical protein
VAFTRLAERYVEVGVAANDQNTAACGETETLAEAVGGNARVDKQAAVSEESI